MESLIDDIYGVWCFQRPAGFVGKARSTPGHLIHYVASGSYQLTTDNRDYDLEAGDLIYYFESEDVSWRGGKVPVTFYSIGLRASRLGPPALASRLLRKRYDLEGLFARSLELYDAPASAHHTLKLVGAISEIVAEFFQSDEPGVNMEHSLWWQLENTVKRNRLFRADLSELTRLSGYSRATVIRACRESTGTTPISRLRDLRMEEAKGLLNYSMSSISDVAHQLEYGRIHEFSREFSKVVGISPTDYRKSMAGRIME